MIEYEIHFEKVTDLSLTTTNTRQEKRKKPKNQSSMSAMKSLTVLEMPVLSRTLIRPSM